MLAGMGRTWCAVGDVGALQIRTPAAFALGDIWAIARECLLLYREISFDVAMGCHDARVPEP